MKNELSKAFTVTTKGFFVIKTFRYSGETARGNYFQL